MIINRKQMAKAKVEKLKQGYSAYAESREVADLIEKELKLLHLPVIVDHTPLGYWFIPQCIEMNGSPCSLDAAESPH